MMMRDLEYCAECGNPTGRAGRWDDSLFPGGEGPYCEDCYDQWPDWKVSETATLRQQLEKAQARVAELEVGLKESQGWNWISAAELAEENGLDRFDIDEMEALHQMTRRSTSGAWLLRKQAEAVEEAQELVSAADSIREMSRTCAEYAQRLRQQANELEQPK